MALSNFQLLLLLEIQCRVIWLSSSNRWQPDQGERTNTQGKSHPTKKFKKTPETKIWHRVRGGERNRFQECIYSKWMVFYRSMLFLLEI